MDFVDTNILIYAVSRDGLSSEKTEHARVLLKRRDLALSVQVLQEFYVQATRPDRSGALTHAEAVDFTQSLRRFWIQELDWEVYALALATCKRFGLSYWDSAILAAARITGCNAVLSEDLSHEQKYDGLRVINPFA